MPFAGDIASEVRRVNLLGRGTFQLTDAMQTYVEAGFIYTQTKTWGAPSPLASTWGNIAGNSLSDTTGQVGATGPFAQYDRIRYSFGDVGGRDAIYKNKNLRLVAGLKGSARTWEYDAA